MKNQTVLDCSFVNFWQSNKSVLLCSVYLFNMSIHNCIVKKVRLSRDLEKSYPLAPFTPLTPLLRLRQVIPPYLIKRLGNRYHRLIKTLVQNKRHFRGQRPIRLEQFIRFNIQGGGKLDQSLGRNPAVAVFDVAQEIDRNVQFFS